MIHLPSLPFLSPPLPISSLPFPPFPTLLFLPLPSHSPPLPSPDHRCRQLKKKKSDKYEEMVLCDDSATNPADDTIDLTDLNFDTVDPDQDNKVTTTLCSLLV